MTDYEVKVTSSPGIRLTPDESLTIMAWQSTSAENNVLPFKVIAEWSGVPLYKIRRIVRSLARKGLVEITTGFNDEGMIMGRGYMPTTRGYIEIARQDGSP